MARPVDPLRKPIPKKINSQPFKRKYVVLAISVVALAIITFFRRSISLMILSFLAHHLRPHIQLEKSRLTNKDFLIRHQHPGRANLPVHTLNTLEDACPILKDCFDSPDSIFRDTDTCESNLKDLKNYYSNSAAYFSSEWGPELQGRTAAFTSFHVESDPDMPSRSAVFIYNVCVHPKARRLGLSRKLVTEGFDSVIKERNLDPKQTLLAVDVDLTTPMAAEAFASYAKMGFMRAWQPCASVGYVDWRPIFARTLPAESSAIMKILDTPQEYIKETMQAPAELLRKKGVLLNTRQKKRPEKLTHFCMFRMYDEGFQSWGHTLMSAF